MPPEEHVTSDVLQLTEAAGLLAVRAKQIADTGKVFLAETAGLHDPVELARAELLARRCPLAVERAVGVLDNGDLLVERKDPNAMTHSPHLAQL